MSRAKFRFYGLKLNIESDKDIIEYLDGCSNKQATIKYIIREFMKMIWRPQ